MIVDSFDFVRCTKDLQRDCLQNFSVLWANMIIIDKSGFSHAITMLINDRKPRVRLICDSVSIWKTSVSSSKTPWQQGHGA